MKVHLRMVGCRLNQSEIETMARQFSALGHEIVDSPAEADHFVLNTCAVTNEAAKTSRKFIRDFNRASPAAETTVTGCYAQIAPGEITGLPGVRRLIGNGDKSQLVSQITGEQVDIIDLEPHERDAPLARTRAFVKAQTAATMPAPSASRPSRAAPGAVARLPSSCARSIICGAPDIRKLCSPASIWAVSATTRVIAPV